MLASVQADLDYLVAFAAAENKPAAVSEWGNFAIQTQGSTTNQGRGDDPQYINTMLDFAAQNHFAYMVYFNITGGGVGQTFASTPLSLAAFRAALTTTTGTSTSGSTGTGSTTSSEPQVISSFSSWQAKYFTTNQQTDADISGLQADPYGSGIPNLLAYALQLDPSTASASDVPQPKPVNGHLTMSYWVPSALTDVSFTPEVSSDLKTWISGSAAVQVLSNVVTSSGATITVQDSLPKTAKKFMRLRVTQVTQSP